MKKTHFILLPLAAFVATAVQAETLDVINVVSENTGAKSKTNIVTLADTKKSTETDLRGLLSSEPSINFGGGNGGTSQWVTIRGMGQDQIDFKVDNTYSDSQIFHHQSRFMLDPSLIKRIDVQKGSGSASAGIGATSGAIIATTVDAKDLLREGQDVGFKLNAGVSSNKGHSQGATVYGKSGAVDALLSGNWTTEEMYKDGNGTKVRGSALGERGLLAKLGVDLNENHRLVLSHRQERYHGVRNLREEFDFTQSGDESRNDPRYRITTSDTTNLEWIGKNLGFISQVKANLYRMQVSRKETDTDSETKVITSGANLDFDSAIGHSHLIKYGLNYRTQEGKPNSITVAGARNQEKDDLGLYAEGIWGFGPITLTTGARYDYFKFKAGNGTEVSKGYFNPSVGLIWEATKDLRFNTSLNYATRSPRLYEVALSGGSISSVDDNLDAEKARNIEVGFNYDFNDLFALEGSYFWQNIKDLQNYSCTGVMQGRNCSTHTYRYFNSGKLKNEGYELGAAYKYSGFTVRAGVAYSKPKLNGTTYDAIVTAVPMGRTWTAGVSYKFESPNLEIGWKGRFVEGKEYVSSSESNRGGGDSTRKAGYGVSDFYASWNANDNLTINFAIDNAFNKYYRPHSQRAGNTSLPAAGRDFRVNVNYTF